MSEPVEYRRILVKTDTYANWMANPLILLDSEQAWVRDGGVILNFRMGDGTKRFSELPNVIQYDQAAYVAPVGNTLPVPENGVGYSILTAGSYNSGALVVPAGNLGIADYVVNTWVVRNMELPQQQGVDVLNPSGSGIPKESAVANYAVSKKTLGIKDFNTGVNIFDFLAVSQMNNFDIWDKGYLLDNGNFVQSEIWRVTKEYYRVIPGSYKCNIGITGNVAICIFDKDLNVVQSYTVKGAYSGNVVWDLIVPENGYYIKPSRYTSSGAATASYYVNPTSNLGQIIDSKYFLTVDNIEAQFEKRGIITVKAGTNMIPELTGSDLDDLEKWNVGYLHRNGTKNTTEQAYRFSNPIKINPVKNNLVATFTGNATCWMLDGDLVTTRIIENTTSVALFDGEITPTSQEKYIQISQRTNGDTALTKIIQLEDYSNIGSGSGEVSQSVLKGDLTTSPSGNATAEAVISSIKSSHFYKEKFACVSFISDDGHQANWEWYLDILNSKNVKSTFAIITGRMDVNPDFATEQQVRELFADGHDIAGHTENHLHTGDLTPEEQEFQVRMNKIKLTKIVGHDNCNMFVAPFQSRTLVTDRIVRQYFDCDFVSVPFGTIANGTCCNEPPIDSYILKRVNFDANSLDQSTYLDSLKQAVDVCIEKKQWLGFCIHPQFPEYYAATNPNNWQQRREDLSLLIDYIISLNIPIMTAKEAFSLWKNPVQLGTQRLESNYYVVGMNGAEEGSYFI